MPCKPQRDEIVMLNQQGNEGVPAGMMWCLEWRVRPCKLAAATTSASHDTHACVLQAFGTTGMVGICTPKLGWALEVTRDVKGITEHSACFKANGRYAPLMHAKVIKLHAIVDLRSPSASPGHQAAPGWHTPTFTQCCSAKIASRLQSTMTRTA